jgi:hypothetical protein
MANPINTKKESIKLLKGYNKLSGKLEKAKTIKVINSVMSELSLDLEYLGLVVEVLG